MSRNYKFHNPEGLYFVSFAVVHWIDVFVRAEYCECVVSNLNYCVKHKGMKLWAWCIMTSHIHLIFESLLGKPAGLLGDFKSVTAKNLIPLIAENPKESRREWMMRAFEKAGKKNSNNKRYQFWQQHSHPIELWSNKVKDQKLDYIHNNPVMAGFVSEPWDWNYSSARDYAGQKGEVEINLM